MKRRTVVISIIAIAACFIAFVMVKRRGVRLNSMSELVEIAMGPNGATGSLWEGLHYCGTSVEEDWFANNFGGWVTYYRVPRGWLPGHQEMPFSRDETTWLLVKVHMDEGILSLSNE